MNQTVIIVNGDDEFLKERVVQDEVTISLSTSIHEFEFPDDIPRYNEFLESLPLTTSDLVVVIWDATEIPGLLACGTTIVVSEDGKSIRYDRAKRTIDACKPKAYGPGYINWIISEGDRLNINLKNVAGALFVNCGTDLRKICSEIGKLKVLSGRDGTVDTSVARSVMCFSSELTPKHIVDAVCDGHPAKAIALYDKLQEGGCETGWIIAYMQRHVLQCLRAKTLQASGMSADRIADFLGIKPTTYKYVVAHKLGLWDVSSLRTSFAILCDMEILHKRGIDVSNWGLEPEIIRLSEEAKHNASRGS